MKPIFFKGHVRADCPDCGAPTTFEHKNNAGEYGSIIVDGHIQVLGGNYSRLIYKLLKCSVCNCAGLAKVACNSHYESGSVMVSFWPTSLLKAKLPEGVPGLLSLRRELRHSSVRWIDDE